MHYACTEKRLNDQISSTTVRWKELSSKIRSNQAKQRRLEKARLQNEEMVKGCLAHQRKLAASAKSGTTAITKMKKDLAALETSLHAQQKLVLTEGEKEKLSTLKYGFCPDI